MDFAEKLQIDAACFRRQIVVAPPDECVRLLECARQDGILVRRLYVLSEPLYPYRAGGCDLAHRDIWVLYRGEQDGGLLKAQRSLFHELAHLEGTCSGSYRTIDEDWDEEARTWERAHGLAKRWGMESIFPGQALFEELDLIETLRENHQNAGLLAGSLDPKMARRAYDGICMLAGKYGWTLEQLSEALQGTHPDTTSAEVVDFDRCLLRQSWNLPYGYGEGDLGPLARAQNTQSARLLHSIMAKVAQHYQDHSTVPNWKMVHEGKTQLGFFPIEELEGLTQLIALVNELLLDHNDLSARAYWWLYAAPETAQVPRLYRLSVSYHPSWWNGEHETTALLPEMEFWILFHPRLLQGDALVEAVWQRYILSWQRAQALRCESLDDGLVVLWHWLK